MYYQLDTSTGDIIMRNSYDISATELRKVLRQERFTNGIMVSTIFVGITVDITPKGEPVLFETMIFCPVDKYRHLDGLQFRTTTMKKAIAIHEHVIKVISKNFMTIDNLQKKF